MAITVDEVKTRLRGIPLFRSLSAQDIGQLAEKVKYELHPPGSIVVRQGEQGEALYIIHSGEVKVWVSGARGEAITRARVPAGNVFGETALLTGAPRNATVETATVTELLRLSKDDFDRLLAERPALRQDIIVRPEARKRLRGARLFSRLSEEDMERVAKQVGIVYYPRGSTICQEGEIGTAFYIIDSGELRSFTTEELARGELGRLLKAGDAFGETSLLVGEPRDATVQVIQDAELLYINKADFSRLISHYPEIRNRLAMRRDIEMRLKAPSFRWQEEDEDTVWFSRRHWYIFARSIFRSVLVWLLVGLVFLITLFSYGIPALETMTRYGILIAIAIFFVVVLRYRRLLAFPGRLVWIAWLVLSIAVLAGLWIILSTFLNLPSTSIAMIVLTPYLLLLTVALIWLYIDWRNDHFVLTSRRIVHVEVIQFFYRRREEARLDKIQDVNVSTGTIGSLLGFGHIRVDTAGLAAGSVTFSYIPAPEIVRELIFAQRRHVQVRAKTEARADLRKDLLSELGRVEPVRPEEQLPQATPPPSVPPGKSLSDRLRNIIPRLWPKKERAEADRTILRKHWIILLRKMALPLSLDIISGLVLVFGTVFTMGTVGEILSVLFALSFVFLLSLIVSFLWCSWEFYLWNNDLYIVDESNIATSKRIPILGKQETSQSSLGVIQNVTMTVPSWWSSLIKLGHVTIETARGKFEFHNVYDPDAVNREISRRMGAFEERQRQEEMERLKTDLRDYIVVYDTITKGERSSGEGVS